MISKLIIILLLSQQTVEYRVNDAGFAVVELFTSEGCSSCPPADRLLSDIRKDYAGRMVYTLSFHVDYWNYIGWKDPFSKKTYTDRQRRYGSAFRNESIYTPQLVVNGKTEFVGHNRDKAIETIDESLEANTDQSISFSVSRLNKQLEINYSINGKIAGNERLVIIISESGLRSDVNRGENRGRILYHDSVVRDYRIVDADPSAKINLSLPEDLSLEHTEVILFCQDFSTMRIRSASRQKL
ncbi:MAG: DUF1223 domain-containing protein [Calditrichaeota bacterium]|nr:DUF1223 domain-containing protein [Calditrichota bacterium]